MGVIDLSAYKPVPATLGDANQVANGFQAIQNLLNGNVDNNNFGAGKIFDPAKIMQNGRDRRRPARLGHNGLSLASSTSDSDNWLTPTGTSATLNQEEEPTTTTGEIDLWAITADGNGATCTYGTLSVIPRRIA
jgi:hypothetical protein